MLTGVILAGGQNRRMHAELKALMPFAGKPLIQRQIARMMPVCEELIVVTNEPKPLLKMLDPAVRLITDYIPGKGPLSGMHAAFALASNSDVWVAGCDMPFVSPEAAVLMQECKNVHGYDAVIPVVNGGLYPLHGIYDRTIADKAAALLKGADPSVSELIKHIYWGDAPEFLFQRKHIDPCFIMSVKTLEEYNRALELEGQHRPATGS